MYTPQAGGSTNCLISLDSSLYRLLMLKTYPWMQCFILWQPTVSTCMLITKTVFAFILGLILVKYLGDQGIKRMVISSLWREKKLQFERWTPYSKIFWLKFRSQCETFGINFPVKYTVKDHISNTKLEKDDHYYIQTRHNDFFFPLQSYSKKTLRKNVPKSAWKYNRNVLMPPGHSIILLIIHSK